MFNNNNIKNICNFINTSNIRNMRITCNIRNLSNIWRNHCNLVSHLEKKQLIRKEEKTKVENICNFVIVVTFVNLFHYSIFT